MAKKYLHYSVKCFVFRRKGIIIILYLFLLMFFTNCKQSKIQESKLRGKEIPATISAIVEALDQKIIKALRENDPDHVVHLFSEQFPGKTNQARIDSNFMEATRYVRNADFNYMEQIYIKNPYKRSYDTIPAGKENSKFILHNHYSNKEMFISLIRFNYFYDEILLTLIYGNDGDGWKLNFMNFGIINILGKNAVEYYNMAENFYEKGHLIDASNALYLCMQCIAPSKLFFQYRKEEEIHAFNKILASAINSEYKLPFTVKQVSSGPKVFNVYPYKVNGKYYPMIRYLTDIKLWNFDELKEENNEIQDVIEEVFPGITKNNDLIYYRAMNEIPEGDKKVMHYGFIQENKAKRASSPC